LNFPDNQKRPGYVYATAPFSFGVFEKEDILILQIPTVVLNVLGLDAVYGFFIAIFILYVYKRLTRGKMPGNLYLVGTNAFGVWARSPWAKYIFGMKYLGKKVGGNWKDLGSVPPPTYTNFHER
jgi:hypothetical protein